MRSAQFDDIYFSTQDGLAETQHTFLDGNDLPARWTGRKRFCVCETGFGTGLNMLAAWALFEETAKEGQYLDLVSIEKYPLSISEMRQALAPWNFGARLERLLDNYPIRVRGFHRIDLSPRTSLTLIFDDVLAALTQLDAQVDAWFLDGFAPAKNPEMWSDAVFAQMARLSNKEATFATFTAAGEVRRGLMAAGFNVEKRKGYGHKRDMIAGHIKNGNQKPERAAHRVAVVGAGLAGLSAAWHLQRAGFDAHVYEKSDRIASGASGNALGLANPKPTALPSASSDYYTSAYAYTLRFLKNINAGTHAVASLQLETDADRARRHLGYINNLGWNSTHMRMLDSQQASDQAGIKIDKPCLFYPDAVLASPRKMCEALAMGLPITFDHQGPVEADMIVYAHADGVPGVSVQKVRGQVTRFASNHASAKLKTSLVYGGYVTPPMDGFHVCGATFQPWENASGAKSEDDAHNMAMTLAAVPAFGEGLTAHDNWVGFRAATADRFPAVGARGDSLLSLAHGSHGIISAPMAGAVLAARLSGAPAPLGKDTLAALDPGRF